MSYRPARQAHAAWMLLAGCAGSPPALRPTPTAAPGFPIAGPLPPAAATAALTDSTPFAAQTRPVRSGTPLETYLPLVEGHVYQYDYENESGSRGVITMRVKRFDEAHGAWLMPGGGNALEYRRDGVVARGERGESYLLHVPLEVGQRWRGGNDSWIEVRRTGVSATVPAGSFSGCVETKETRGGDVPLSITATFCPAVGLVERAIASGNKSEHIALRSFGPKVDVGPDGVRVLPDPAAP